MKISEIAASAALCAFVTSGAANAAPITMQTFDTDPPLAANQAPGVWYEDRFPPAGFESESFRGDNRLAITVSSDDNAAGRPSNFSGGFYNTQGRKFDTPGANQVSIDYFIDPAQQGTSTRTGGFWLTGVDGAGGISSYPIFEFFDDEFQVFDFINGGFDAVGVQSGFAFDEFVNLGINLDTTQDLLSFFVNDELLTSVGANGTQSFANVILQNINTTEGVDRTVYFDNLSAASVSAVPVPAALPLMLTALGGIGFVARRRRNRA